MTTPSCANCDNSKAPLLCSVCTVALCKACAEHLDADQFCYVPEQAAKFADKTYCRACFESHVAESLAAYDELVARAREVRVYFKNQSQETRLIKRKAKAVTVSECRDYHDAILRLAVAAAATGHNAVVDLNLTSKKWRDGGYQKNLWHGSALPVNLDARQLARATLAELGSPN